MVSASYSTPAQIGAQEEDAALPALPATPAAQSVFDHPEEGSAIMAPELAPVGDVFKESDEECEP